MHILRFMRIIDREERQEECLLLVLKTNLALQDPSTEVRWNSELSLGSVNLRKKNPGEPRCKIMAGEQQQMRTCHSLQSKC